MYVTFIKIFLSRNFWPTKPDKCVIQRYFNYSNIPIEVQILRKKCRILSEMFHCSCIYSKYKKGWYCFKIFGIIALPLHTFHLVLYTITTATNTLSLCTLRFSSKTIIINITIKYPHPYIFLFSFSRKIQDDDDITQG